MMARTTDHCFCNHVNVSGSRRLWS